MHDLDRTQNMFEGNYEMGYEFEGGEGEFEFQGEGLFSGEFEGFNEVQEMELAAELLEITNEYELDHFLGKLINSAKKAGAGALKSSGVGSKLGGFLKGAAKMALPALGNMIAPGIGGVVASKLGGMFGLELEGLSPQDQEFEAARAFVKFAGEAAKNAANASPMGSPQQIAKNAIVQAAQTHAPGLLRPGNGSNGGPQTGRYSRSQAGRGGRVVRIRRGERITVIGV